MPDFDILSGEVLEQAVRGGTQFQSVPHIDQFFDVWAIRQQEFDAGFAWFQKLDLHLHLQQRQPQVQAAAEQGSLYGVTKEGIAVIDLRGALMKQVSSMSSGTSTVLARRQVRAAAKDPEVFGILLRIDSPGGTAAGTKDLADDVAAAAGAKPVYAFIEDLGASAAYWVASQASKVFTNPTGIVGSIGTYMAVMDLSGMAAKEGIKVHVIKAGEMKGAGTPGTEITARQLEEWQKTVNDLNDHFVRGVAAGRGLSLEKTRALADGRVHVGQAALEKGLVDGVQSLDATLSQLVSVSSRRRKTMAENTTPAAAEPQKPAAATIQHIRTSCKGADEKFILAQLEAGATLEQARDAWIAEQQKQLDTVRSELKEKEKTKPPAKERSSGGFQPLVSNRKEGDESQELEGDVVEQFHAEVAKIAGANPSMEKRQRAIVAVARKNPALHQAYLAATQTTNAGRRLVGIKNEDALQV